MLIQITQICGYYKENGQLQIGDIGTLKQKGDDKFIIKHNGIFSLCDYDTYKILDMTLNDYAKQGVENNV